MDFFSSLSGKHKYNTKQKLKHMKPQQIVTVSPKDVGFYIKNTSGTLTAPQESALDALLEIKRIDKSNKPTKDTEIRNIISKIVNEEHQREKEEQLKKEQREKEAIESLTRRNANEKKSILTSQKSSLTSQIYQTPFGMPNNDPDLRNLEKRLNALNGPKPTLEELEARLKKLGGKRRLKKYRQTKKRRKYSKVRKSYKHKTH
jgi:hypothetical protein